MIIIACATCASAIRVVGEIDEVQFLLGKKSDWYPDRYPCWKDCDGLAQYMQAIEATALSVLDLVDLTPHEAFIAFHGMGLPAERECSPSAIQKAFEESPVKKVHARQIKGSHRSCVDLIELEDGTRVFLGSSAHGAVVYRISSPHSYAEAVNG